MEVLSCNFLRQTSSQALHKSYCQEKRRISSSSAQSCRIIAQLPPQAPKKWKSFPEVWIGPVFNPVVDAEFWDTLRMSLQGLLWVKDSHAVSYMYSLLRNLQNIRNVCRITALNGLKCLCAFMGMCVSKNNTDRQRVKAPLPCQINIDSTEGNGILLYTVKNTTWINFTISQFGVLIKKNNSHLWKDWF